MRGRATKVPGVSNPEAVGFLDYHILPGTNGAVYLDYYNVRRDSRGRGYGRMLVEELYRRFPDAPWIDWGDVMSAAAEASWKRIRSTPGMVRTHGKLNPAKKQTFSSAPLTADEREKLDRANVFLMDWVCEFDPKDPSILRNPRRRYKVSR
jgi:hypothetical protein